MIEKINAALAKLRASSDNLNALTDQISEAVKKVEDYLNITCSAGVYGSVNVWTSQPGEYGEVQYQALEYRRVGNRFRIAVVWGRDLDPEDELAKPWVECSRDEKLETAKKLPDLIIEISKRIDKRLSEAESTKQAISAVLKAITAKEGA